MRGTQGTWEMFTRIPGNLSEDSDKCYHFHILGNVPERMFKKMPGTVLKILGNAIKDSGECYHRFRRMLLFNISGSVQKKIPRNFPEDPGKVTKDSRKCYQRSRVMFKRIPGERSERFRGIFKKIPGNAFNSKLIKATFYLKRSKC